MSGSKTTSLTTTLRLVRHNLGETEQILTARAEKPEIPILSLPDLNRKLWGLHTRKLCIIGARTAVGKSAFSLQLAFDIASQGISVLFLSLEMTITEIVERLFCHHQQVSNIDLLTGKFGRHKEKWDDFCKFLADKPLAITDGIGKTWQEIDATVSRLNPKPKVIFVDYIQTIAKSAGMKEEIDEYLRHFREMAIRDNFCGVVCSQVNRSNQESDDKEPRLHQLKGSGFLEELCDLCLLLHWPHKYNTNEPESKYKLIIAKNRNGRTGYVDLVFKPEFYLFKDEQDQEPVPSQPKKQINWNEGEQ